MKRIGLAVVAAIILLIIFVPAPKKSSKDEADEKAAIAAIRSRYEPSIQLMSMNPDPASIDWMATYYPLCDSKTANCWRVAAYVDVMPQAEKKTIEAEWIVDLSTGKDYPKNTEARLMYSPVEATGAIESPQAAPTN